MSIYKPHLKNLRVGFTEGTPDASSSIQLDDTTVGFLPNRLTTTQRNAITSPATGLLIYNTTANDLEVYNGSSWIAPAGGLATVSGDTTPALGGNLTVAGFSIVSTSNGNIGIAPNGTGTVVVGGTTPTVTSASTLKLATAAGSDLTLSPGTTGLVKFGNAASAAANGSVATVLGSVGPTGANTTVQEWLVVKTANGTRYIPCF